jgi:hypothetical protein
LNSLQGAQDLTDIFEGNLNERGMGAPDLRP